MSQHKQLSVNFKDFHWWKSTLNLVNPAFFCALQDASQVKKAVNAITFLFETGGLKNTDSEGTNPWVKAFCVMSLRIVFRFKHVRLDYSNIADSHTHSK